MTYVDDLRSAGLSEYEVKAYNALLAFGEQTGREASAHSGVPPTRVFDVLRQLQDKGLVQLIQQNPMVWSAIKPEVGIKSFIERKISGYGELEERLIENAVKVKMAPEKKLHEDVMTFTGFQKVFSVITEYLNKVSKTVSISSVGEVIPTHTEIASAKATKRGVTLRFIATTLTDENRSILKRWQGDGWIIRHLPGSKEYTFAVFDKKSCMIIVKNPVKREERILIVFENPDLSMALEEYFGVLWKRAKPI